MTATPQDNTIQENKPNDKEYNFRLVEARYQKQLELERNARLEAERQLQDARQKKEEIEEEDDGSEPYVEKKRLEKKLAKHSQQIKQQTQSEIQQAVQQAIALERQQAWIKNNPDFYEVLGKHADTLAAKDPDLAETILSMPEGFERQKLVYKNIKALGIDRPEIKQTSIQDKVDANRRSPYYQPSGIANAPYANAGDFSEQGRAQAYEKMKQLKNNLRLG